MRRWDPEPLGLRGVQGWGKSNFALGECQECGEALCRRLRCSSVLMKASRICALRGRWQSLLAQTVYPWWKKRHTAYSGWIRHKVLFAGKDVQEGKLIRCTPRAHLYTSLPAPWVLGSPTKSHGSLSWVLWSNTPGQESGWEQIQIPVFHSWLWELLEYLNLLDLSSFSVWWFCLTCPKIYPWGKTVSVLLSLPIEWKLLLVDLMDRHWEEDIC